MNRRKHIKSVHPLSANGPAIKRVSIYIAYFSSYIWTFSKLTVGSIATLAIVKKILLFIWVKKK